MNRRGFLGALVALVGAVVAKVNGPTTPPLTAIGAQIAEAKYGTYTIGFDPASGFQDYTRFIHIRTPDGLYKWEPTTMQRLVAERHGFKIDTKQKAPQP
jgi:hypothetical protein